MAEDVATEIAIDGGFVVGHDGSACADHAVRWTLAWARRADMPVHVVRAWTLMTAPRPPEPFGYVPSLQQFEQAVRDSLAACVDELRPDDGPDVQVHTVHGAPGPRLIAASANADLLVVGARGLGGFAGLVLGSVSEQCVRHAHCPVTVVRQEHAAPGLPAGV